MSDALERYAKLSRLHARGQALEEAHPEMFAAEAKPWAVVVREVGFRDIDARADFEKAAHTFDESSPRARDVRAARAAVAREARSTAQRMSDDEAEVAMLSWMHVRQVRAETRRIAASVAELSRELGAEEQAIIQRLDRARADGLVTLYRDSQSGTPDLFCLSEDGLVRAADPTALVQHLAKIRTAKNGGPILADQLRRQLEAMSKLDQKSGPQWLADTAALLRRVNSDFADRFQMLYRNPSFSLVEAYTTAAWTQMDLILREAVAAAETNPAPPLRRPVSVDLPAKAATMDVVLPELAGSRWIPIRELGRGGGGVVYLCVSRDLVRTFDAFGDRVQNLYAVRHGIGGPPPNAKSDLVVP